ncbi:MAG: cobalamin biosynthesis protein CbiX [Verrucomicrobia bacterium]|nr:cobalamin biosynthesis protein CbiX [Verrucomicrobiota bacterium]
MAAQKRIVFLTDNGSLRPAATRRLRRLATALARELGERVVPVSLLHANRIPATRLGGRRAEIFETALRRRAAAGARDFLVMPLFLGPSAALTGYLAERVTHLRGEFPDLCVRVAPPLAVGGEDRLAEILESLVRRKLTPAFLRGEQARIALVDHGSPTRDVTRVRNRLAALLRRRLGPVVTACSMERRPGAAYAFNEPLLENLLASAPWRSGPVIVAQLFLLPGGHAGPGGDIAAICRRVRARHPRLRIARTALLGEHPGLIGLLAERFRGISGGGLQD